MFKNIFSCFIHNSPKLEIIKYLPSIEWVSKFHTIEYHRAMGGKNEQFIQHEGTSQNLSMIPLYGIKISKTNLW